MLKSFIKILSGILIGILISAVGAYYSNGVIFDFLLPSKNITQVELNQQYFNDYNESDNELNRVFQEILIKYSDNQNFLESIKGAQKKWIDFRDADVQANFPGDNPRLDYGSVYPMCVANLKKIRTETRIKELALYLSDELKYDACSGVIK